MSVAADALAWAVSRLGLGETTGHNDGPWVAWVLGEDKRLSWCAAFVQRAFQHTGVPLPGNFYKNRAVLTLEKELRRAGAEIPTSELQPGDIITFERLGGGHIGIVETVSVDRGSFTTIEGNVANAVRRVHHQTQERNIRAVFRWPALAPEPPVAAAG